MTAPPERRLALALGITVAFMAVEVVAGVLTGSLALLSDAGHMLTDAGALGVALLSARVASRPPDPGHPMGHQRAEVLGAAVNGGVVLVLALWIVVEAVGRLGAPREVLGGPMMVVAGLGLLVNLGMAALLASGRGQIGTRAALLNVLGDALGSVGALVAGALVLWGGWLWADPAASLFIAGLITVGAIQILREAGDVLMQAAPVDVTALAGEVDAVEGVASHHDLFVWSLRPGEDVVTVHVVVAEGGDPVHVADRVRDALREAVPTAHVTVQAEWPRSTR